MKTKLIPLTSVPAINDIKRDLPDVKAFFFDMDGTLFNTENVHADALFMMAKKYQIIPPIAYDKVYELMVGKADHLLFEIIKDWEGVPRHWDSSFFINEKNDNFIKIIEKKSIESFFSPKVHEFLKEAYEEGMFMGHNRENFKKSGAQKFLQFNSHSR